MNSQDWLTLGNIALTALVGVVLFSQIRSQKTILDKYRDFVNAVDFNKVVNLKDQEIEQLKKVMSNDINVLQKQISELSFYANHTLKLTEKNCKEVGINFDRDDLITDVMPSCRNILNTYNSL